MFSLTHSLSDSRLCADDKMLRLSGLLGGAMRGMRMAGTEAAKQAVPVVKRPTPPFFHYVNTNRLRLVEIAKTSMLRMCLSIYLLSTEYAQLTHSLTQSLTADARIVSKLATSEWAALPEATRKVCHTRLCLTILYSSILIYQA